MYRILLDLYGADGGVAPLLAGAKALLAKRADVALTLFGPEKEARAALGEESRVTFVDTADAITNLDPPTCALRGRESASLVLALDALKADKDARGLLSAGNTGALLVGATFRLGLEEGLKMPALSSSLPTVSGGRACLVDCGANVGATAADLVTFAKLGVDFARKAYRKAEPTVALLSVGREPGKGSALLKEAYPLLEESGLRFLGNAEGSDLVNGYADVFVCDGYAGNLMLKCTEAVGKAAQDAVQASARAAGLDDAATQALLEPLRELFDLNERGGATFLGVKKPIVKMHGCATAQTVVACAEQMLFFL